MTDIDALLGLFDERDRSRVAYNEQIMQMLTPTTMLAIFELFDLPPEMVEWKALELIAEQEMLLVVVDVHYKTSTTISPFLKLMDIASNASKSATMRTLRLGIPLTLLFKSKEEIQQYVMGTAERLVSSSDPQPEILRPPVDLPKTDFDTTKLTKEQIEQLLLFKQTTTGETQ